MIAQIKKSCNYDMFTTVELTTQLNPLKLLQTLQKTPFPYSHLLCPLISPPVVPPSPTKISTATGPAESLISCQELTLGENHKLPKMILKFTPHLCKSFTCSQAWWDCHWGMAGAHVRFLNHKLVSIHSLLTLLQMFKYLLVRGIGDILVVFNNSNKVLV